MDDDMDLKDYIGIIKRYWGWVMIAFILVFAGVATYTYMSHPVYEAKSLIVLTPQDQANFILGSSAPKIADIETQKVIIQSPNVLSPIYGNYHPDTFKLEVTHVRNSNIIEVNVQASNPKDAVNIANDIALNYIDYSQMQRKAEAEKNIEFISEKIDSLSKELASLDAKASAYRNFETLAGEEKMKYQDMQREMTAKTKLYDYLLTKREEAALAANMESANLKLIQPAVIPEFPVKPNKPLNLAVGFLLAIGAGALTATLIDSKADRKNGRRTAN